MAKLKEKKQDQLGEDSLISINGNSMGSKNGDHTEEIDDIVTKVPSWIVRRGITVFFVVLILIGSISFIISYPDVITTRIRFQPVEADSYIISPAAAVVDSSLISQNAIVKKGQLLAVILADNGKEIELVSPTDGQAGFASFIERGALLHTRQQLFVIHPLNQHFFGIILIPATIAGQVKIGQHVMVSLGSDVNNDNVQIDGIISLKTDEPDNNGLITLKISFIKNKSGKPFALKSWMTGVVQIATKDKTVGKRIWDSIIDKL